MLGIIGVGHFYRASPVASRRRWRRAAHNACVSERIKRSGETTDHIRGESLSNYLFSLYLMASIPSKKNYYCSKYIVSFLPSACD